MRDKATVIIGLIACLGIGFIFGSIFFPARSTEPGWDRTFTFSSIMGTPASNPQGEELGKVDDFVVDEHGHVAFAILSHGEKSVPVPYGALNYDSERKHVVLNTTKEKLDNAPSFDKSKDLTDRKWAEGVYRYFGQQPYWTELEVMGEPFPRREMEGQPSRGMEMP